MVRLRSWGRLTPVRKIRDDARMARSLATNAMNLYQDHLRSAGMISAYEDLYIELSAAKNDGGQRRRR